MINVLWLEDDQKVITTVTTKIEELEKEDVIHLKIKKDFDAAKPILDSNDFDVIVLDLREGSEEHKGLEFFRQEIWEKNFCPVIFFSGSELPEEVISSPALKHRLVHHLVKGDDSVEDLIAKIEFAYEQVSFSKSFIKDLKLAKALTLRDFYEKCGEESDQKTLNAIAEGTLGRRISALVDYNVHKSEKLLHPVEMYIWPPIKNIPLMVGDVLLKKAAKKDEETIWVILTPSCDLVREGARAPKVSSVLMAKCFPIGTFLTHDGDLKEKPNYAKFSGTMIRKLKVPVVDGKIFFPQVFNIVDPFYADLKMLETFPITDVEAEDKFERILSLDSPFRESFVWGVVNELGRPGLPDRNYDIWAEQYWSKHPKK